MLGLSDRVLVESMSEAERKKRRFVLDPDTSVPPE